VSLQDLSSIFSGQLHEPTQHYQYLLVSFMPIQRCRHHFTRQLVSPYKPLGTYSLGLALGPRQPSRQLYEPRQHYWYLFLVSCMRSYSIVAIFSLHSSMGPHTGSNIGTCLQITRRTVSPYKTLSTYSPGSCMSPRSIIGTFS
jgi:hypothetical protein